MAVAGVDVWKSKWVGVVLEGGRYREALVDKDFSSLVVRLGEVHVIGVDMPIGLPGSGEARSADAEARKFVGPKRASSVFPVYPRAVYLAGDYASAAIQSVKLARKSISRQAFAIGPRLLEVDAATAGRADVYEVHPEVSFCAMARGHIGWSKTSWNGMHERARLLEREGVSLPAFVPGGGDAAPADLIDAAAAAWTAMRIANGQALSLPKPPQRLDRRQVAIWY